MTDYSQGTLINIINRYLVYNNIPIEWHEFGVCNGLVWVHAYYKFQGKENKYWEIVGNISNLTQGTFSNIDKVQRNEIDNFIKQVIMAFKPNLFDKDLSQHTAFKLFQIENKFLEQSLSFSLVADSKSWVSIFKDLDLKEGELMFIDSTYHVVSVYKKDGKYFLYNPNSSDGEEAFDDEESLVKTLREDSFQFKDDNLGLSLRIVHNEANKAYRRDKNALYSTYYKENKEATYKEKKITNMSLAANSGDYEIMSKFLEKNEFSSNALKSLANKSIGKNNTDSLRSLIDHIEKSIVEESEKDHLFSEMIQASYILGSKVSFNLLLTYDRGQKIIKALDKEHNQIRDMFFYAAVGGNSELLTNFVNAHDKNLLIRIIFNNPEFFKDTINYDRSESIDCLFNQLKDSERKLEDDLVKEFLNLAINKNNHTIVSKIIKYAKDNGKDDLLKTIEISDKQAETTNLRILTTLKENGVPLSVKIQVIMKDKETHNVGIIEIFGIYLNSFVDYILDKLNNTKIQSDTADHKKRLMDIKDETPKALGIEEISPEVISPRT